MQDRKSKWQGCFGNKQSRILQPASSSLVSCFSTSLKMKAAKRVSKAAKASHPACTHCTPRFCSLLYSSVLSCLIVIADTVIDLSLTRALLPQVTADSALSVRYEGGSINKFEMAKMKISLHLICFQFLNAELRSCTTVTISSIFLEEGIRKGIY